MVCSAVSDERRPQAWGRPAAANRQLVEVRSMLTCDHWRSRALFHQDSWRHPASSGPERAMRDVSGRDMLPLVPRDRLTRVGENLLQRWVDLELRTQRRIVGAVVKPIRCEQATGHGPVTPNRVSVGWRV
jgi:hypothetical protein